MTRRGLQRACLGFVLLSCALASAPALGAEDAVSVEKASVLFDEGRALMVEQRYSEACERFEQSLALADGIGTRFNLAACYEMLGRTATAQELFAAVSAAAEREGQGDRARVARERASKLESRLSRLVIDVELPPAGVRIVRNRTVMDAGTWGKPLPVDPGTYEIEASAPGTRAWSRRVVVPASRAVVWVAVPPLAPDAGEEQPCSSCEAANAGERRLAASPPSSAPPRGARQVAPATFGLATLGLAGVGASLVFGLKYRSSNDDAKNICAGNAVCTREDIERYESVTSDARASRLGAYISAGIGGAALAAAAISHFGFPRYRSEGAFTVRAEPILMQTGTWGLAAQGSF